MFAVVVEGIEGVKKFFLALFTFPEKLHVVYDEHIDITELVLKPCQVCLFDGPDELIDKVFAAQHLYDGVCEFLFCLLAHRMEQVCFSES